VSVEDDERSGQTSTSKTTENVEKIWELTHEDHQWTTHEFADTIGISYGVCQAIITENLNMHHIAAKFVPWLLTNDQKQWLINVCFELWEKAKEDPTFISRIITGDEIGFTVMSQKQRNSCCSGRAHNHQAQKKGAAGPEFNKEHDHCFFRHEGGCSSWICSS
jgi:hypothetical protein